MTLGGLVSAGSRQAAFERRIVTLAMALCLAMVVQALLAAFYGEAAAASRDVWSVAIVLWLGLSLTTAAVVLAVWNARDVKFSNPAIIVLAIAGAMMRLPYFGAGPMLEDDHFRYLLDGALITNGISPYAHAPQDLLKGTTSVPWAIIEAGREQIASINFPDLRSIYPGGAQAVFAVAYWAKPWSVDGLRAVIFGAEVLTALLAVRLLTNLGRPPILAALYWCNPLMAFSLTGLAHIDAALAPAVLLALIATDRRAPVLAGLALSFAAGVKLWPVLLAPLIVRWFLPDRRAAIVFAAGLGAGFAVLCGPLVLTGALEGSGLTAYAKGWSINNAPYAWASYGTYLVTGDDSGVRSLRLLIAAVAGAVSLAIAFAKPSGPTDLVARAGALAAAVFYLSPAQFPWYSAWFVALAAVNGSLALTLATAVLPIYFLFFPLAANGLRDWHSYGLSLVHVVPVAALLLATRWSPSLKVAR